MRGLHAVTAAINRGAAFLVDLLPVAAALFGAIGVLYLLQAVRWDKR